MSLKTGYNLESPAVGVSVNGWQYVTNDFDLPQVWDGISATTSDTGLVAPVAPTLTSNSAGNTNAGTHLVRIRYENTRSPNGLYRSNPSPNLTVTNAAAQSYVLAVTPSADARVDTIIIEATAAAGTVFYEVASISNTLSAFTYNLADTSLIQNNLATTYGEFVHSQPPIGSIMAECRGYVFLGGTVSRTRTVTVTNNSTSVTGTNFSPNWAGRLMTFGSDTTQYVINASTTTTLTLATAYTGSTNTGSAIISSKNPNRIFWSKQYFPESWDSVNNARDVMAGRGDNLTGFTSFLGDMWLFGTHSMQRLVFVTSSVDNPGTGEIDTIPGEFGVWNQRCLVGWEGQLFGWGPNGVWLAQGWPRWISRPIDVTLAAEIDITKSSQFNGSFDPLTKMVRFWYVRVGETTPRACIAFDTIKQRWCQHPYRQGIAASTPAAKTSNQLVQLLGDSNGYIWQANGVTDGVPATSSGKYTGNTGSTTTVIQVNEALPTAGTGLVGVMLYRPSTGEERLITANTASSITVAALASSPSVGESLYAGSIPWNISTGWWTGSGMQLKKRPARIYLKVYPGTTGTATLQLYQDGNTSPYVWTNPDSQQYPNGISIIDGQSLVTIDFSAGVADGMRCIPMPEDWERSLKATLTCNDPSSTIKVLEFRFAENDEDQTKLEDRQ